MKILPRISARLSPAAVAHALARALAMAALWTAAGCALPPTQPGLAREAVLAAWGPPSARHVLAEGAERLEYASGPFGRTTWMLDLDTGGRLATARQVLNEAHFAEFQARAPGLSRAELLRTLGTPGDRKGAGLRGGELWSWRYPTNDCLWFQVTLDTAVDKVRDAGYGIDPRCDGSNDRN